MAGSGAENYTEAFYDSFGESVSRGVVVMRPATVVKYDRNTHNVAVQPLVALADGDRFVKDGVVTCTVWRPYSGHYLIDMPLDVGDTGWVIAADVDTDNVKRNCVNDTEGDVPGVWSPKTRWTHRLQHGFFIPDRWGERYKTDDRHVTYFDDGELDKGRLVIQSSDGKQRISVGTVGGTFDIRVDAASVVSVNAPFVAVNAKDVTVDTEKMSVTAKSGVRFDAPEVEFTGKVTIDSGANGTITPLNLATVTNGVVTGISK